MTDESNKVVLEEERWIELENDSVSNADDQPEIQDLFADPDPYDTFSYSFRVSRTDGDSNNNNDDDDHDDDVKNRGEENEEEITITLNGFKAENGQLLNSTGLTLWRASSLLCQLLCANPDFVRGKRVLELGAGLGLCGILAHRLGAAATVMTDGDTDTLENMRKNVDLNLGTVVEADGGEGNGPCNDDGGDTVPKRSLPCAQLRWGRNVSAFKQYWTTDDPESPPTGFDVVMGSDIIYAEDILEPLFDTVLELMSPSPESVFLLAYARRNVKIDLVFECGERHGLTWIEPEGVEGVFIFSRS